VTPTRPYRVQVLFRVPMTLFFLVRYQLESYPRKESKRPRPKRFFGIAYKVWTGREPYYYCWALQGPFDPTLHSDVTFL